MSKLGMEWGGMECGEGEARKCVRGREGCRREGRPKPRRSAERPVRAAWREGTVRREEERRIAGWEEEQEREARARREVVKSENEVLGPDELAKTDECVNG
jgi:hypothetical protein